MENPWNIESIYELQYFNCPSCKFKNYSKQKIVSHAYEFHPESIDFLIKINDNSLNDVICPWSKCETIKIENYESETVEYDYLVPKIDIKCEGITSDFDENYLKCEIKKKK